MRPTELLLVFFAEVVEMAFRDKSQGFGFVYVDVEKLLAQRDELSKNPLHPQAETAQTINLNRDKTRTEGPKIVPVPSLPSEPSLADIREKLDKLQTLHHKLHVVLEELSTVTGNDTKKKN
jgi:hypothetical protein